MSTPPSSETALVGAWRMINASGTIDSGEAVEMVFEPDGRLCYAILEGEKWSLMLMHYRVEGDQIISNQPSAPHEERTRFSIQQDGSLSMIYHDALASFARIPNASFPMPKVGKSTFSRFLRKLGLYG